MTKNLREFVEAASVHHEPGRKRVPQIVKPDSLAFTLPLPKYIPLVALC